MTRPGVVILGVCIWALATTATATTFIVPTDDEMVARSGAIVIGTIEGSYVRELDSNIETVYEVRVQRTLKGPPAANGLIRVVSPGGVIADRAVHVDSAAHFRQGERVLLFLTRATLGWQATDMTLGKFRFVQSTKGDRLLVRDMEDVVGWDHHGQPHREKVRREAEFLRFVEERAHGRVAASDYVVEAADVTLQPAPKSEGFEVQANAPFPGYTYVGWVSGQPTRWPNISAGVVFHKRASTNISGLGDGGVSVIQNATASWNNECSSNINLIYGGTTNTASANFDAVRVVEFNDPQGRVSGSWTGAGTIALTFTSFSGTHPYEGRTWWSFSDADVVFQDGFPGTHGAFPTAMTHEIGHGIGWRHSNENHQTDGACNPAVEECTSSAIMNSMSVASLGYTLQTWDINAAQSVYPGGTCGPSCTPPSITQQPVSRTISLGQTASLTVGATGTTPLAYQWYNGTSGNTSSPIGGGGNGATLVVQPPSTRSYWVRVSNSCGAVNSATVTVTVSGCTAPSITSQPQSRTISQGQIASLTVSATGTGLSYQWYNGTSGNTSSPIGGGGNSATLVVQPASTRSYWVRVSNSCGSVNSATATVTVSGCTAPAITAQPQSRTISQGQITSLTVTATGTGLSYQWYNGTSGNTSSPIGGGGNSATLTVQPPSTRSYWVRITNSCGSVNSNTATVFVN